MMNDDMRRCKECGEQKPAIKFPLANGYRRRTCRQCINAEFRHGQERRANQAFNRLVNWPTGGESYD